MTGYRIVNLKHVIDEFGEDRTKAILSEFSCPLNQDMEKFIKEKAIEFTKQGLAGDKPRDGFVQRKAGNRRVFFTFQ